MGMPVPGGNPTAPFVAVLYEAEENGAYGMIVSLEDVSTVTLSIVQVGAASGGGSASAGSGGVFVVNGIAAFSEDMTGISGTFDKTIAEVMEAHHAGKIVQLRANFPDAGATMLMMASIEKSGMIIWQGILETMIVGIYPVEDGVLQGEVIRLAMASET
jgi:hypothetical protein